MSRRQPDDVQPDNWDFLVDQAKMILGTLEVTYHDAHKELLTWPQYITEEKIKGMEDLGFEMIECYVENIKTMFARWRLMD